MSKKLNQWIYKEGFEELRKTFPNRCKDHENCKCENMEFAHIKPTKLSGMGRGKIARYYDIMNNPDSYFLCCHEKHLQIDSKKSGVKNYERKHANNIFRVQTWFDKEIRKEISASLNIPHD